MWVKYDRGGGRFAIGKYTLELRSDQAFGLVRELSTLRPGTWLGVGNTKAIYERFGMRNTTLIAALIIVAVVVVAVLGTLAFVALR